MSDVIIDPEAMAADAEDVWERASDRVLAIKDAIPTIATPDFSLVFDASAIAASYRTLVAALESYLDGGSTEFLRFEKKLLEAVIIYGEAQGLTQAEIAALEKEIDL